jgi:hypothetical protein
MKRGSIFRHIFLTSKWLSHTKSDIWEGNGSVPDGHFPKMWQFLKFEVRGKLVAVSQAVRNQLMTPQQQQESKQQQGCWQQQGSQQQHERQLLARDTSKKRRPNLNSTNASNSRICVEKL